MMDAFWKQQTAAKPLYPDIAWSKPEQRMQAGRIGIIGGNKLGFAGVAESYSTTYNTGAGYVRVVLPDALKKMIPPAMTDVVFAPSNPSGSLSKDAVPDLLALASWSTMVLMAGDAGRNSETAIAYETFIRNYQGPLVITRDAVDLVKASSMELVERPQTLLVVSFAQVQKIFQSVYYPKVLTFSMQLTNLIEALHKFTSTYPVAIEVLHRDTVLVAHDGQVTTTPWDSPMQIWRGTTAAKAATMWAWNPSKPLESITASLLESTGRSS